MQYILQFGKKVFSKNKTPHKLTDFSKSTRELYQMKTTSGRANDCGTTRLLCRELALSGFIYASKNTYHASHVYIIIHLLRKIDARAQPRV